MPAALVFANLILLLSAPQVARLCAGTLMEVMQLHTQIIDKIRSSFSSYVERRVAFVLARRIPPLWCYGVFLSSRTRGSVYHLHCVECVVCNKNNGINKNPH